MFKYLIFILLSSSLLYADTTILEKDVPIVPRTALLKLAGKSTIDEITVEKDENSLFYHAKWQNGAGYEATVTEDGNLAIFIESIQRDNAPPKVRKTIESLFSKATATTYARETFLVYKVKITVGDKNYEALVSPSGKMVGIKEVPAEFKSPIPVILEMPKPQ